MTEQRLPLGCSLVNMHRHCESFLESQVLGITPFGNVYNHFPKGNLGGDYRPFLDKFMFTSQGQLPPFFISIHESRVITIVDEILIAGPIDNQSAYRGKL